MKSRKIKNKDYIPYIDEQVEYPVSYSQIMNNQGV